MKMRNLFALFSLFFGMMCFARPALNVNIVGVSPGSTFSVISAGEGLTAEHPHWNKNESQRQRWIWAYSPEIPDNQWRKFEIRFKIDRSQPVHISFERQRLLADEKYPLLELRNLKGTGFQLQSGAWEASAELPRAVPEDNGAILVPAGVQIRQVVSISRNDERVLSGEFRFTDKSSVRPELPPLVFESRGWKLSVDADSGLWNSLSKDGKIIFSGEFSPFEMELGDGSAVAGGCDTRLISRKFDAAEGTLALTYQAEDWLFIDKLTFGDGAPGRLRRDFSFQYAGNDPDMRFGSVKFHYPFSPKGEYLFPGTFFNSPDGIWSGRHNHSGDGQPVHARGKLESLYKGIKLWAPHYVGVQLVKLENGPVLFWGRKAEREGGNTLLTRRGGFAEIVSTVSCGGWAEKGKVQTLDPLYVEISKSQTIAEALRRDVPEFYRATGQTAPADRPEEVYDARIFGSFFPRFQMASLDALRRAEAERVRDMGFNVFYLPPVQVGGTRYSPFNFRVMDYTTGTFEDYRALVNALNANGVVLMQDVVPHGGDATALGERLFNLHGLTMRDRAADFNSPSWNCKMADHIRFYSRMGAKAYRVDAAAGSSDWNWRRAGHGVPRSYHYRFRNQANPAGDPLPPGTWERYLSENGGSVPALEYDRASMAGLAGALRMAHSIRTAAREVNGGWTMLETHGYPYTREGDLCYDILMRKIPYKFGTIPADEIVRETARYLTESRLADVPGALYLRNILSNDERIALCSCGFAVSRPMHAMLYFAEGVPLAYSDGMYGNYRFFQKLNAVRERYPALRHGVPVYRAEGNLLTIERTLPEESVLGILNFSAEPQAFAAPLPAPLRSGALIDAMTGRAVARKGGSVALTVPPFGTVLLAAGEPELPAPAPEARARKRTALKFSGNRVETDAYVFEFDRATGLPLSLADRFGKPLSGKWRLLTNGKVIPESVEKAVVRNENGVVEIASKSGGASWRFLCRPDRVEVSLLLPGDRSMLVPAVKLEDAQINVAGALWEEHVSPAYAAAEIWKSDFSRGVFRRPNDYALLADSRELGLDLSNPSLRLSSGRASLGFAGTPGDVPSFRLYRQFSGTPGLHLLFSGSGTMTLTPSAPELKASPAIAPWKIGEVSVTDLGSDYRIENKHCRMTISKKGGMVREFTGKSSGTNVARNAEVILRDRKSGRLLRSGVDYESRLVWKRIADGVRLTVDSELRGDYARSERFPVLCSTEFVFRDSAEISFRYEVSAAVLGIPRAELGLRLTGADGKEKILPFQLDAPFRPKQVCGQSFSFHPEQGVRETARATKRLTPEEPDDFSALLCRTAQDGGVLYQTCDSPLPGTGVNLRFRAFPTVRNGEAVLELRFPDPNVCRTVSPANLTRGRWRLSVAYSGEGVFAEPEKFRQSAWNPNWNDGKNAPAKVGVALEYLRMDGTAGSVSCAFEVSGTVPRTLKTWEFEIPEEVVSPVVRINTKLREESRLFIHAVKLEELK